MARDPSELVSPSGRVTRCPTCLKPVQLESACRICGTPYHTACLTDGCLVAGCGVTPGAQPQVRGELVHSRLWSWAFATPALLVIGWIALAVLDGMGLWRIGGLVAMPLVFSALLPGGLVVAAGFRDLVFHVPEGASLRPDRLGTMALMLEAVVAVLAMLSLSAGYTRSYNPYNRAPGIHPWLMGCYLTGALALVLGGLGLVFDSRRIRASVAVCLFGLPVLAFIVSVLRP